MNLLRSSLSRIPSEPTSEQELEEMRRRAWLESGVATIKPADLFEDDWFKQAVVSYANKRWGKRLNGKV